MICFESHITDYISEFFHKNLNTLSDFTEINAQIKDVSGINNFFNSQNEASQLLKTLKERDSILSEPNRREYGDFQTNIDLAFKVAEYAFSKHEDYDFVLEPTCGKGNFILASIKQSNSIKKIVGVEIYQLYVWETKFKILTYFSMRKNVFKPEIDIIHGNAFEFPFDELAKSTSHFKTLVIGNPTWVTNSELGTIDSKNLPQKSNFKKHNGFDAMTGKGNFDIGESISTIILKHFENHNGVFAFLIKNSVVKNLIQEQKRNRFRIGKCEKLNIDSKVEFNVSVKACLFLTHLNK